MFALRLLAVTILLQLLVPQIDFKGEQDQFFKSAKYVI